MSGQCPQHSIILLHCYQKERFLFDFLVWSMPLNMETKSKEALSLGENLSELKIRSMLHLLISLDELHP